MTEQTKTYDFQVSIKSPIDKTRMNKIFKKKGVSNLKEYIIKNLTEDSMKYML